MVEVLQVLQAMVLLQYLMATLIIHLPPRKIPDTPRLGLLLVVLPQEDIIMKIEIGLPHQETIVMILHMIQEEDPSLEEEAQNEKDLHLGDQSDDLHPEDHLLEVPHQDDLFEENPLHPKKEVGIDIIPQKKDLVTTIINKKIITTRGHLVTTSNVMVPILEDNQKVKIKIDHFPLHLVKKINNNNNQTNNNKIIGVHHQIKKKKNKENGENQMLNGKHQFHLNIKIIINLHGLKQLLKVNHPSSSPLLPVTPAFFVFLLPNNSSLPRPWLCFYFSCQKKKNVTWDRHLEWCYVS